MSPVLVTGGSGYLGTQLEPGAELPNLVIHNDRAKRVFGWKPRPIETTIVETAESLRDLGLLEAGHSM